VAEGFYELLRGHGLQAVREGNGSYTCAAKRCTARQRMQPPPCPP
jgi:hypothetical protein